MLYELGAPRAFFGGRGSMAPLTSARGPHNGLAVKEQVFAWPWPCLTIRQEEEVEGGMEVWWRWGVCVWGGGGVEAAQKEPPLPPAVSGS